MSRKKESKGSTTNHSTRLSIDNNITLSKLIKIFVTNDDWKSFRNDQNDRLDCIQKAVAKLRNEGSEILEKFLQYGKDEKAARRERC